MRIRRAVAIPLLATALTLTGCGSSADTKTPKSKSTPSARPSGGASIDASQAKAIQKCLKAAGLGSGLPAGMPTGQPNGDTPPEMPTEGAGQGPGSGQDMQKLQEALKACGLTLPGPRGSNQ